MSEQFLLVVYFAPTDLLDVLKKLRKQPEYAHLSLLIVTPFTDLYGEDWALDAPVRVVACDYKSAAEIRGALSPFRDKIIGVVCRGDKHVQYLRRVLPELPPQLHVASEKALAIATNKRAMRAAFAKHAPEISPQFLQVHDDTHPTIEAIEKAMSYPVIVKPASLVSSLLIQLCHNARQLEAALHNVFSKIDKIYEHEGHQEKPEVVVEEFMQGDLYSIDAYVLEAGELYFCPPVAYVTAQQLGIDDFFLYRRVTPTALSTSEVLAASQAVAKAVKAVGLTHSSAHVEVVRTADGWKVIELGPRIGRFRHLMYGLTFGIDHAYNDVLVHLGRKPHIPVKQLQYSAAYSVFSEQTGVLREIQNMQQLENNPLVRHLEIIANPGDTCRHAKEGGHALAEVVVASPSKQELQKIMTFIEQNVRAIVD